MGTKFLIRKSDENYHFEEIFVDWNIIMK